MISTPLPSARELGLRLVLLEGGLTLAVMLLAGSYLCALLDLSSGVWTELAAATAIATLLAVVCLEPVRRNLRKPLMSFLEGQETRDPAHANPIAAGEVREAFRSVISLPSVMQRYLAAAWLLATGFVAIWMHLSGAAGWGLDFQMLVLMLAGVGASALSAGSSFFLAKRGLAGLREALAARIPDPMERQALIRFVSLAGKVRITVVGSLVLSLLLALSFGVWHARVAVETTLADWQRRLLTTVAIELSDRSGAGALDRVVASQLPPSELMPVPVEFRLISPGEWAADEGSFGQDIREDLAAGLSEGTTVGGGGPSLVVWKALGDGRLLLCSVARDRLWAALPPLWAALAGVLTAAIALGLGMAQLLASDLRRMTGAIGEAAQRMTAGDLRSLQLPESEDELGELARCFGRIGSELRSTVDRVSETANGVDALAGEIASVSEKVAAASNEQAGRIEQAMELMVHINGQVSEVSGTARALNLSVEESSSSILELGAAGEELNETASVLSAKVDEVSTSIEEMVRSVKHVRSIGEGLKEAAVETASSMEEMASAMRAVDNTAEMTANLSREVVESAESGQAKVSQTIDGMQAIRDATDAAEAVIRGLGQRTEEIGAILDVIEDVADETNLLALNAAIIAAQAGEHGRAFSVVADEIKELADRVLASTKEIGGLIRSVQSESSNAVGAIEEGSRSVASGVQLSAAAGVSLEGINRSAQESGNHIGEILVAVQEQAKAATHVVDLMDRVRNAVEQIAAAGSQQDRGNETVYRSAVTMSEVAQQVRRTTEEQSRGFGRIRESVEGVRDAVEQINGSLQEQTSACSQVAEFLEQVVARSRGNAQAAQGMGEVVRSLSRQAEALRDDVARFET
jgi:methyl-accepting chemotaxis protein